MNKPSPRKISRSEVRSNALDVVKNDKFPMLASIDGDRPRVRPVSPVRTEGFTVFVANLRSYAKTKQIQSNPNVELCYLDKDHNQVRIQGRAAILDDEDVIEEIWKSNPLLKHYLGTPDNPELIIYRIDPDRVSFMQEWALEYFDVPLS